MEGYQFIMGSPSGRATKFWNMVSLNDEEGEITLYGDVVSRQPVDWWTGEPEPGLYITPEGFMEDLESVKDKKHVTVKLNSCGGDLYTGIAIHNALKSLNGEVNVIVDGIAASAASVIMCAGDTVTVYPGSIIMIHGVSVHLWDSLNIEDMKQLMKGMDASERAVAEIYHAKTGIETDKLRNMMSKEKWFTGREALEEGFADVLKEEDDLQMSLSVDKKVLFCNGISHNVEGFRNIPGTIPVDKPIRNNIVPAFGMVNNKTHKKVENKGGKEQMTLEELKKDHPELVAQIEQNAVNAVQLQMDANVGAERKRIEEIDSIAASIPDQKLVHDAKYGDNPCTAQELCFRVMQQSVAAGQQFLADYKEDAQMSGTGNVKAVPNSGAPVSEQEQDAADILAVVNAYKSAKGVN